MSDTGANLVEINNLAEDNFIRQNVRGLYHLYEVCYSNNKSKVTVVLITNGDNNYLPLKGTLTKVSTNKLVFFKKRSQERSASLFSNSL